MAAVPEIEVYDSVDHLFRHHAGQMVSVLCRIFGFHRLDLIEDAVQDALVAALRKWSFTGIPDNPTAWLTQTAKHRIIDVLRRNSRSEQQSDDLELEDLSAPERIYFQNEIAEDQLRMIFACCHPSIAPDSQIALTLKTVGGFSVAEIASAYLSNEAAVAKMLTRAKARLRDEGTALEMPPADEIIERRDAVLRVLYLMFNEGYSASSGDEIVRRDLCFEAIRLVELLSRHPLTASPNVNAAAALFMLQAARLPARTDEEAGLILLAEQDRSLWDKRLIAAGLRHIQKAAVGSELSVFHLEAEIAGIYTLSESYETTDWKRILECYNLLQKQSYSPVAELNRIIVLERIAGTETAIAEMEKLSKDSGLENYGLYHSTHGYLLNALGRTAEADAAYRRAISLTRNEAVRRFIASRLS